MRAFIAEQVFTSSLDDEGALLDEGAVVVGEDGRIARVGPARDVVPAGCERVEVTGVLLPGLFDVHTHLCLSASEDPGRDALREHPARVAVRAVENLRLHLEIGVTTIRDVGGVHGVDLELQRMVDEGVVEGPDVFAAGNVLCMTGGHGCFMGVECDGADEMRKAARAQMRAGARLIKLIATGGVITPGVQPGAQQLTYEEMRAACEEARKASRTVAAHAQGEEGILAALRAGVDTIEHGFWLTDEALALMAEEGRTFVPTFAALRAMVRMAPSLPAFIRDKLEAVVEPQLRSFQRAVERGVRVATGTDAGTPGNPHGNLKEELEAFQELGVAPRDCWRAATIHAARALRLDDRGELREGTRADLIAIERAALDDVTRFLHPHLVVKRGTVLVQSA